MALDTAVKRFSVVHLGSPWRGVLPLPDGSIGVGDRQIFVFLAAAVLAEVATGYSFTGDDLTTVFRAYLDALHDTAIVAADTDTLVYNDQDEMIAGTTARTDRNSRYSEYLH